MRKESTCPSDNGHMENNADGMRCKDVYENLYFYQEISKDVVPA